jgi:diguanylate cyclase (GGDEF)-like protein/PAS domain S-box-containing protein
MELQSMGKVKSVMGGANSSKTVDLIVPPRLDDSWFRTMFEHAPMGIALDDSQLGGICAVNPMYARILGRSAEEIMALDWQSITHPDDLAEDLRNMEALETGKTDSFQMEKRYLRPDGTFVWVNMIVTPITIGDDQHRGHICMLEDITERKLAEENLRESEEKFRTLFEESSVARLTVTDLDGKIHVNRALCDMLGYGPKELTDGSTWQQLTHPEDIAESKRMMARLLTEEISSASYEKRFMHKRGHVVWTEIHTSLCRDGAGRPKYFMTTILDIDQRKSMEEQLRLQATTDDLTGIANRRCFFEAARRELKRVSRHAGSVSMAFIDVDDLKTINDTHGHAAGDRALLYFTDICEHHIRDLDLLARLGGDEFALLLPSTDCHEAEITIERIRAALGSPEHIESNGGMPLGISVGVACRLAENDTVDEIMRRADLALYEAKSFGKNRTIVYEASSAE